LVWAKQIGGSSYDRAYSITTDSSGNVLVGGYFRGDIDIDGDGNNDFTSSIYSWDSYAAKFDSNGNLVWAKQIGGGNSQVASSITTDSSGNVLVGGHFYGNIDIDGDGNNDFISNGSWDGYAAKFDSNGNFVVWAKQIGGSSWDTARSITTDSSGNVLVGSEFQGNIDIDGDGNNDLTSNGSWDGYAAKFDSNGNLVWAKQIGGSSDDYAESITTDSSGNVLVGGEFQGNIDIDGDGNNDFTSNGNRDGYAAKFDSNGNLVWAKQIGGSSDDRAYSITTDSSDNVLVGGYFQGNIDIDGDGNNDFTSNGGLDAYAAKFDSNGNWVWAKQIGGSSDDRAYSITTDSSGNVLVGGGF
jgi:phage gp45-like